MARPYLQGFMRYYRYCDRHNTFTTKRNPCLACKEDKEKKKKPMPLSCMLPWIKTHKSSSNIIPDADFHRYYEDMKARIKSYHG